MCDKFTYNVGTILRKKQTNPFDKPCYLIIAEQRISDYGVKWYKCFELDEPPSRFKVKSTPAGPGLVNIYDDPVPALTVTCMEDDLEEETIKIK